MIPSDENNVVLQFASHSSVIPGPTCQFYSVPGVLHPCRIVIYACDSNAQQMAAVVHTQIEDDLESHAGNPRHFCDGPGLLHCMTWSAKNRLQILVPVIGQPISGSDQTLMLDWQKKAGPLGLIIPALLPNQHHSSVFANCPTALSRLNIASWSGNPKTLASTVLRRALHDHRPGLFISYSRAQASALVDQLYDKLSRRGFRIFLDRFSGTPGSYFPKEIAEEMADRAVLLVIETSNILRSRWTLWEVSFAHQYRLGILALNVKSAPKLRRITKRLDVTTMAGALKLKDLDHAVEFVQKEWSFAALRRRAFYEGLVTGAASASGGAINDQGNGFLLLENGCGIPSALISPSGRPGRLGDIRPLAEATMPKVKKLLLGQHRHLPQQAYDDLYWLAQNASIELHDRYNALQLIKKLC